MGRKYLPTLFKASDKSIGKTADKLKSAVDYLSYKKQLGMEVRQPTKVLENFRNIVDGLKNTKDTKKQRLILHGLLSQPAYKELINNLPGIYDLFEE